MTKKYTFNYYADQLSKLDLSSTYPTSVKFFDGEGKQTNQIDLNAESIDEIKKLFKKLLKNQVSK
jgi:hypothetical protein